VAHDLLKNARKNAQHTQRAQKKHKKRVAKKKTTHQRQHGNTMIAPTMPPLQKCMKNNYGNKQRHWQKHYPHPQKH